MGCITSSGPKPNVACVFPFIYKDKMYHRCISVDHNQPWCATKVNNDGSLAGAHWGNCDTNCPREGKKIYYPS